jgi:ECF transporter S component (folate family)
VTKVKKLVLASLLLTVLIVVERLVSIETQFLRVSFAYVPIMLSGILLGPVWSGAVAALGDMIGMIMFPKGAYFPGFTLSAFLTGLIHGLFLFNTKDNRQFLIRLIAGTFIVLLCIHTGLNSLWLVIMYKKAFAVFAPARVIAAVIMFPIQTGTMFLLKLFLDAPIKKFLNRDCYHDDTADEGQ